MKKKRINETSGSIDRKVVNVGGYLREIVTVSDQTGKILHQALRPLMLEFRLHDVIQVIVGAILLAIPVGFTQEAWDLGATLPPIKIAFISGISVLFLGVFVFFTYYKNHIKTHWPECIKRVLAIYLITLVVVGVFLTLIDKAPWDVDLMLAIRRTILVAFPASMSAAVVDVIDKVSR